jgi:hypothetical protein
MPISWKKSWLKWSIHLSSIKEKNLSVIKKYAFKDKGDEKWLTCKETLIQEVDTRANQLVMLKVQFNSGH